MLCGVLALDVDSIGVIEGIENGSTNYQTSVYYMGIPGTMRASFALYNTMAEVDALVAAVDRVRKMF